MTRSKIALLYPYIDLIAIGLVIALTMYFTVEVPESDDWDLVPILQKVHQGALDWTTIDTPYAGHKITVPYLVMVSVAEATHWNTYVFRAINLLLLISAWAAVRPIALKEGRLLETAIFFWSLNQWACWLWTWMIMSALAIVSVLWCLRLLVEKDNWKFALAMALAVVATFSWSAGLAVWPASAYMLFLRPRPAHQRVIFGAVSLATALLFLWHRASAAKVAAGQNYMHIPLFFLLALGAPAGFATKDTAVIVSLLGLGMLVAGRPSVETLKARPFTVSVFVACAGMMGMLVLIRGGGSNPAQGMDSRYGAIAALSWTALILLVDWTSWRKYVLTLLVALCLVRDVDKLHEMASCKAMEMKGIQGLLTSGQDRFLLKGDHTTKAQFDADVGLMQLWHYSVFKNK